MSDQGEGRTPGVDVEEAPSGLDRAGELLDAAGREINTVLSALPEPAAGGSEPAAPEPSRLRRLRAEINMLLEETRDVEGRVVFAARNYQDHLRDGS